MDPDAYPIPSDYELVDFVKSGDYGIVAKCKRRDTGESVAIKLSRYVKVATQEATILQELMSHNLNLYHVVKFYDWYQMNNTTGLVLELLDMSLTDYMKDGCLPLKDIRLIIQQLATAFDALKRVGVIHGDVKPDNIMLVKDQEQSFTVKLIDFGMAFHTSEAKVGSCLQIPYYRAPEIMLGLPFTEAIDMWSLGIVMSFMMLGDLIFPWSCDYNQIKSICQILGKPADHLLDAGLKTEEFFKKSKTSNNQWTLMSDDQYWKHKISFGNKRFAFSSLDDLQMLGDELESKAEAKGWRQCIKLLKAMLQVDARERITPSEVLKHPFITQSYLNEALQPAADEPSTSQAQNDFRRTETDDDSTHAGQVQDQQGSRNTLESLSDTLSCDTLMLNADPAADPDTAQDSQGSSDTALDSLTDTLSCETLMLDADPAKDTEQILRDLEDTTSDDSESHQDRKKKKKKNCIRCFFSGRRKSFSCCSVEVEE